MSYKYRIEAALVALSSSMLAPVAFAQTAGVTGNNDIPGLPVPNIGATFSDMSGDGTTIAGTVRIDTQTFRAFRITGSGYETLQGIGTDAYVLAKGVSDDGTQIVGLSAATSSAITAAVLWDGSTLVQLQPLNTAAGTPQASVANGISGNGQVIVGSSFLSGAYHAVRWVNKGAPQDIHGAGLASSFALRASRDGSVVVGYGSSASRSNEAFVWNATDGMRLLGVVSSQSSDTGAVSRAQDVSADGQVVVGFSQGSNIRSEAFRWTSSGGMVSLGLLAGGTSSSASGVNADGSVIVGSATRPSAFVAGIQDTVAIRWTSANGLQTVVEWLSANGVAVGSNTFTDAVGISDDGKTIIGTGQINGGTQQYIARIATENSNQTPTPNPNPNPNPTPTTGSGVVGLVDYLSSISSNGVGFNTIINAASLTLFGAHHRPLTDFAQPGQTCVWLVGDFAKGRNGRNGTVGEFGLCQDLGSAVRIGAGGGIDAVDQDLSLGGTLSGEGYHLVGEIDVRPVGSPVVLSLTGYFADWNLRLNRVYDNAGAIDLSRGLTKARTWALRGRIDWRDLLRTGAFGLSPYAAFTHSQVTIDGYTEQGGGFPVQINTATAKNNELRLGAVAALGLGQRATLRASGEWVGRLDRSAPSLNGMIVGATAFSVQTPLARGNWGRIGTDLDVQLGRAALLTFSLHSMIGRGEDARVSGSIGLRFAF